MKRAFAPIAAAMLAGILLSSCGRGPAGRTEKIPSEPGQDIEDFSITETREGLQNWSLQAASAQIMEQQKKVLLNSPQVRFFQDGSRVSDLAADSGRINTDNYDIWGDGECLLTTVKGETLSTKNIHYRSDTKKIVTDEEVTIVRPGETITGVGMEATPDLKKIKIKKQKVIMNK